MSNKKDTDFNHQFIEEFLNNQLKTTNKNLYQLNIDKNKPYFSIMMPPPNVTGNLHLGHALVTSIQDCLIRFKKMQGYNVLWQAGTDHAGIATQMVVERELLKQGVKKESIGKEKFLQEAVKWKDTSGSNILNQLDLLGAAYTPNYIAYTMDDNLSNQVLDAFITLYNNNLIYQDLKLVNWDCKLQTAISDLEVKQEEINGKMYHINYQVAGQNNYIEIATTRPETMFGDVAIAVNPKDERFNHLIGKFAIIPILNKQIPIIGDDYVDISKGSGGLKVTPAHDFNDFNLGKKHNLSPINILNKDGTLNNLCPKNYIGLYKDDARKTIIEELKSINALVDIKDYKTTIPKGDRSQTIIEPMLSPQWYVNVKEMAKNAINVVKEEKIKFHPKMWENLYFEWLNNVEPWCISRQLWWGHKIPLWYKIDDSNQKESHLNIKDTKYFAAKNYQEALAQAQKYYNQDNIQILQVEDVLDTWFSSSLWCFSTLKSSHYNQSEVANFYPTSTLVTAFDIIFFWVARMIMMSLYFTKTIPFKDVFIHSLIKDENGEKMSKSKGNVIDPLDIIKKYGTDSLRWFLLSQASYNKDIRISEKNLELSRNFITKIINSYKFLTLQGVSISKINIDKLTINLDFNHFILFKLNDLKKSIESHYNNYRFSDICNSIYHFVWNIFCDWYLEFIKPFLYSQENNQDKNEIKQVASFVFQEILIILHPLTPYTTDFIWQQHNQDNLYNNNFIINNLTLNNSYEKNISNLIELITKIRNIKATFKIESKYDLKLYFLQEMPSFVLGKESILQKLVKVSKIETLEIFPDDILKNQIDGNFFGLFLGDYIDKEKEKINLNKDKLKIEKEINLIEDKLNNHNFIIKAKESIVFQYKDNLSNLKLELSKIIELLRVLN
jgi:valyl-tRNA synthetase